MFVALTWQTEGLRGENRSAVLLLLTLPVSQYFMVKIRKTGLSLKQRGLMFGDLKCSLLLQISHLTRCAKNF